MKIEKVKIKIEVDETADQSCLGEFTDELAPGVISTDTWDFLQWQFGEPVDVPERGRDYRFFRPYAGGEKVGTKNYYKYGKQDAARMAALVRGDWQPVGITAEAIVSYPCGGGSSRLETLTSGGLWGVESDCPDYVQEVMAEQLEDLRGHLQQFGIKTTDEDWTALCEAAIEKVA